MTSVALRWTAAFVLGMAPCAGAQDVQSIMARGDEATAAFKPAEALRLFEQAIALDSTNAEALGKASRSAVDLGESEGSAATRRDLYERAVRYARRSVAADPSVAEWHFGLARALGRLALSVGVRDRVRYAVEIRDEALKALQIEAYHPGALHVMGMWHAEVKRLSGFERFFAQTFLGGGVLAQANWDDAVTYLERAVQVDPDRLVHHLDLAKIYADVGQKAKARERYEFVINATKQTDVNDPLYKRQAEAELKRLR